MADKKLSSSEVFNQAVKPFIDHKNAYQDYKGTKTEGDIPRTEQQEIIAIAIAIARVIATAMAIAIATQ